MATRVQSIGEGHNQNKFRVVKIFYDQHRNAGAGHPDGRAWWAYCERQVDGSDAQPIGELMPVSSDIVLDGVTITGWDAPWLPEAKYVKMAVSGLQGPRFRLDYQRMRTEYEAANRTYYDLVNNEAFSKGWAPVNLYGAVPYQIRALKHIGAPPKSPKLPEAAAACDKWLLGFTREENERLAHILATDNGRLAMTPAEVVPTSANPLAELSADDIAELSAFLKQRKQAATMRDAKKKSPSHADAA